MDKGVRSSLGFSHFESTVFVSSVYFDNAYFSLARIFSSWEENVNFWSLNIGSGEDLTFVDLLFSKGSKSAKIKTKQKIINSLCCKNVYLGMECILL